MTRRALGGLLVLFTACGGNVDREGPLSAEPPSNSAPDSRPGGAGDGSDDFGGAAAGDEQASGGHGSTETPAGGAGGGETRPALIGSATRYCEDGRYCFGLACYAPFSQSPRACIATCAVDTDCRMGEVCLQSEALEAGCYAACETPFDCAFGFDCFDFAGARRELVCFPSPWAREWERLDL